MSTRNPASLHDESAANAGAAETAQLIRNLGQALSGGQGSALESNRTESLEDARRQLGADRRNACLDRLQQRIAPAQRNSGALELAQLSAGLDQLHAQGTDAQLSSDQRIGLEALVALNGRPALAVVDKPGGGQTLQVDVFDPSDEQRQELGEFRTPLALMLDKLEQRLPSVGRIDLAGVHKGSGFVVAAADDALILTNRHVLELLATPEPGAQSPTRWELFADVSIDFSPSADDASRRFRLREVVFAGPDPIWDQPPQPGRVDLALLRVERLSGSGRPLPPALGFARDAAFRLDQRLLVCGYPAEPQELPSDAAGRTRRDVVQRLFQIFGLAYGCKYLSPGKVKAYASALAVFDHDATTLAGSSGSCVLNLDDALAGIGLHCAGLWLHANQAHAVRPLYQAGKAPALAGMRWL